MNRPIFLSLLPLILIVSAPAHAEPPTLAVAGVELASALRDLESQVIASLEKGLRRSGTEIKAVNDAAAVVRQPICETSACARDAGSRIGVAFIAFAQIESTPQAFTITVKILRSKDGAELSRESLTCVASDPCAPIPQSVREVALEAGRKAKSRFDEAVAPVSQPTPPPEVAEVEPIPSIVEPIAVETTTKTQHESSMAAKTVSKTHIAPGWFVVSAVAATGAIVAGTVMIGQDGDCSQWVRRPKETCGYHHSGAIAGIALVSGGALLMAASAGGYLLWGRDSEAPSIALTHNSVTLTGRF